MRCRTQFVALASPCATSTVRHGSMLSRSVFHSGLTAAARRNCGGERVCRPDRLGLGSRRASDTRAAKWLPAGANRTSQKGRSQTGPHPDSRLGLEQGRWLRCLEPRRLLTGSGSAQPPRLRQQHDHDPRPIRPAHRQTTQPTDSSEEPLPNHHGVLSQQRTDSRRRQGCLPRIARAVDARLDEVYIAASIRS
jgi:hypothetical protein